MNPDDLTRELHDGESLTVEFKATLSAKNERGICKEIAAFATSRGGRLFIGIDDNGVVVGVETPEIIRDKIERWVSSSVNPPPILDIKIIDYESKKIVLVEVANGTAPFYQFDFVAYIRTGTSSEVLDTARLIDLVRGRKIEDVIASIESTLSMTHSLAMAAMNSPSPAIHGQGDLATMSYAQLREMILAEIAASPLVSSLQSGIAAAQSMASYASMTVAPAISGQDDLATMSYSELQERLVVEINSLVAPLYSTVAALQTTVMAARSTIDMFHARFANISAAAGT